MPSPLSPSTVANLEAMRRTASEVLDEFLLLWDRLVVREGDRAYVPYGSLPGIERLTVNADDPPSSRLTCDVALGYLAAHVERPDAARLDTAFSLLRHAFTRQHAKGWFVWNYGQSEIDQVDLGTVLDTYWWFHTLARGDMPADVAAGIRDSARRAADYLATAEQPDFPGIIQKRAEDPDHPGARRSANYFTIDALNGNALAATAWCRAADILGDASMIDRAAAFERNLVERFGAHAPGWWAYVERLGTREMLTPETILYQAMTALYLEPLLRARPTAGLRRTLAASLQTLDALVDGKGGIDWSREARQDFVGTQLLMLPSAAAALADVWDLTGAGRRRLERVARTMVDPDRHWLLDEDGTPADELRQIWGASDLALIALHARRHLRGLSA
jgi:hypothetical protein